MEQEEFKAYQRQLSKKQVDFLEDRKKLCPTIILGDDLFDASIGDIPIAITPPAVPVIKVKERVVINPKNKPLF